MKLAREDVLTALIELRGETLHWTRSGWPVKLQQDRDGYLKIAVRYKGYTYSFAAHRAIWFLHYGAWPKNQIDHINHVRNDNRIENLRDVTARENYHYRRPRPHASNRSSPRLGAGVTYRERDRCWVAVITIRNKRHWLGQFKTEAEARTAREAAEQRILNLGGFPMLVAEAGRMHDLLPLSGKAFGPTSLARPT